MAQVIKFELKKAFANTKNRILIVLYVGALLAFLFYNMEAYNEEHQAHIQHCEEYLESKQANLPAIEARLAFPEEMLTKEHVEYTQAQIAASKNSIELYSRQLVAMKSGNHRAMDAVEMSLRQHLALDLIFYYKDLDRGGKNVGTRLKNYQKAQYQFMAYCVENNIELLKENEMLGWNYLYSAIKRLLPRLLPLYLLLLLCDMFSTDNATGNFKVTLLQPLPRSKLLISKIVAAAIFGTAASLLPLLLVFLLAGALNGFGSPAYPLLTDHAGFLSLVPKPNNIAADILDFQDEWNAPPVRLTYYLGLSRYSSWDEKVLVHFTPNPALSYYGIALFSLLCLPLLLCFTLLCSVIAMSVSLLTQDSGASMVLCILIALGTFLASVPLAPLSVFARLNPFLYTFSTEQLAGIGSSTVLTGCLVLLGYSVALTVLSCRLFKKKDVRC